MHLAALPAPCITIQGIQGGHKGGKSHPSAHATSAPAECRELWRSLFFVCLFLAPPCDSWYQAVEEATLL